MYLQAGEQGAELCFVIPCSECNEELYHSITLTKNRRTDLESAMKGFEQSAWKNGWRWEKRFRDWTCPACAKILKKEK